MTVEELRTLLATFPDKLTVVFSRHSEYTALEPEDITVEDLYENGGYYSRPYEASGRLLAKPHLTFPGN